MDVPLSLVGGADEFHPSLHVVELDFFYPSEGIYKCWDNGYQITSTAATWDQASLILSVPKRKLGDETQVTLRTSAFPSTHVKALRTAMKSYRDHKPSWEGLMMRGMEREREGTHGTMLLLNTSRSSHEHS